MKPIIYSIVLILFVMPTAFADQNCIAQTEDLNMTSPTEKEEITDKNVLDEPLQLCCNNPVTGFYRNGFCQTGKQDVGTHVACAELTQEFLEFSKSRGNDLMTPMPDYNFPGLKAGDKWCLCANRWTEALEAGVAPPLILESTHHKMLEYAEIEVLKKHTVGKDAAIKQSQKNAYQFSFKTIDGKDFPLYDYKGSVLLIVNTASQCGFTDQYTGLQELYEKYRDQGLVIIGVPCNDFGNQEPGDLKTIKEFTEKQFGVTFPLTQKYSVKGDDAHPFFTWASNQNKGAFLQSSPKWNFHKFLIDRNGNLVISFGSQTSPTSSKIKEEIENILAAKN